MTSTRVTKVSAARPEWTVTCQQPGVGKSIDAGRLAADASVALGHDRRQWRRGAVQAAASDGEVALRAVVPVHPDLHARAAVRHDGTRPGIDADDAGGPEPDPEAVLAVEGIGARIDERWRRAVASARVRGMTYCGRPGSPSAPVVTGQVRVGEIHRASSGVNVTQMV